MLASGHQKDFDDGVLFQCCVAAAKKTMCADILRGCQRTDGFAFRVSALEFEDDAQFDARFRAPIHTRAPDDRSEATTLQRLEVDGLLKITLRTQILAEVSVLLRGFA